MDVVEFRRLMDRIVATRNAESRAFLQAFDLAPAVMRGSAAQTNSKWDVWTRNGEALRVAVAALQIFLAAEVDRSSSPGNEDGARTEQRMPPIPRAAPG